jgi:hypothetical protein
MDDLVKQFEDIVCGMPALEGLNPMRISKAGNAVVAICDGVIGADGRMGSSYVVASGRELRLTRFSLEELAALKVEAAIARYRAEQAKYAA